MLPVSVSVAVVAWMSWMRFFRFLRMEEAAAVWDSPHPPPPIAQYSSFLQILNTRCSFQDCTSKYKSQKSSTMVELWCEQSCSGEAWSTALMGNSQNCLFKNHNGSCFSNKFLCFKWKLTCLKLKARFPPDPSWGSESSLATQPWCGKKMSSWQKSQVTSSLLSHSWITLLSPWLERQCCFKCRIPPPSHTYTEGSWFERAYA